METTRDEIEGLMKLFNAEPRRRYDDSDEEDIEENSEQNTDSTGKNCSYISL